MGMGNFVQGVKVGTVGIVAVFASGQEDLLEGALLELKANITDNILKILFIDLVYYFIASIN